MIKLPKFNSQSMYDYETNFHLTMNEERYRNFYTYEAYKITSRYQEK